MAPSWTRPPNYRALTVCRDPLLHTAQPRKQKKTSPNKTQSNLKFQGYDITCKLPLKRFTKANRKRGSSIPILGVEVPTKTAKIQLEGPLTTVDRRALSVTSNRSKNDFSSKNDETTLPHHEPPAHPQIEIHTCLFIVGQNRTSV